MGVECIVLLGLRPEDIVYHSDLHILASFKDSLADRDPNCVDKPYTTLKHIDC